jgi:hypothetical protein
MANYNRFGVLSSHTPVESYSPQGHHESLAPRRHPSLLSQTSRSPPAPPVTSSATAQTQNPTIKLEDPFAKPLKTPSPTDPLEPVTPHACPINSHLSQASWQPVVEPAQQSSASTHSSFNPPQSPTAPLQPIPIPDSYEWNGTVYGSLDGIIDASGVAFKIPGEYIGWIKTVITTIVRVQVATAYNALKDKVYEHKAVTNDLFDQLAKKVDNAENVIITNHSTFLEEIEVVKTAADNLEGTMNMQADRIDSQLAQIWEDSQSTMVNVGHLAGELQKLLFRVKPMYDHLKGMGEDLDQLMDKCNELQTKINDLVDINNEQDLKVHKLELDVLLLDKPNQPAKLKPTFAQATAAPPLPVPVVLVPVTPAPAMVAPVAQGLVGKIKVAEPTKFTGDTKELSLEVWIRSIYLWFEASNVTEDWQQVVCAMSFLTGKAADYISDLSDKLILGQQVTLEELLKRLRSAYQEINPVVKAQHDMDVIMEKSYKKLLDFTEAFCPVAFKTQFSDQDLIKRIN